MFAKFRWHQSYLHWSINSSAFCISGSSNSHQSGQPCHHGNNSQPASKGIWHHGEADHRSSQCYAILPCPDPNFTKSFGSYASRGAQPSGTHICTASSSPLSLSVSDLSSINIFILLSLHTRGMSKSVFISQNYVLNMRFLNLLRL